MGQVIIEGVVSSDVCDRGAQHTVEWTDQIRAYVRNGLIRIVAVIAVEPAPVKPPRSRPRRLVLPVEPVEVADEKPAEPVEPLAD